MSKKIKLKPKLNKSAKSEWEIVDTPIMQDGGSVEKNKKILKEKGILPEQEFQRNKYQENLSNNLSPIGYNLNNFINALYKKNKRRQNLENEARDSSAYASNLRPKSRLDAFNFYMGKPQKYNTFDVSNYRPSKETDSKTNYYKLNYFQDYYAPDSNVTDLENLFKTKSLAEMDFPFLFSKKEKQKVGAVDAPVMANYTLSKGEDEKGKYYSYYDKWDISPMDFGKPFEIYDRIYYDPETNKIVSPKKQEIPPNIKINPFGSTTIPPEFKSGGSISQQGYKDDSPYRNRESINIHSPNGLIDMSETGIPILANGKYLPPYSGMHQFEPGVVREERIMQDGGDVNWSKAKDKVKATLNPYNWGVTDYTDKGTRGQAYNAAKKAGEKEFMWNNQRFNTNYAGTVEQEAKSYFPGYNTITGIESTNYPLLVASYLEDEIFKKIGKEPKDKYDAYPHAFTADIDKKAAIDFPNRTNFEDFGAEAYPNTEYYASKIKNKDKFFMTSKEVTDGHYGEYDARYNNCAGAVCSGLGLPYSDYQTPAEIPLALKLKYPTVKLTSNKTNAKVREEELEKLQSNKENLLNSDPKLIEKYKNESYIIRDLQNALEEEGYKLPNSRHQLSSTDYWYDGVFGDETKKALLDYKNKLKSPSLKVNPFGSTAIPPELKSGGSIPMAQNNEGADWEILEEAQNGKKISLEDFMPKNPNSNERIQQQIINNSNFNRATKGTNQNPVSLPEVEVVAQKNRNPATAQAAGQRWREANKDKEINSGELASAMFLAPVTEALHTPSRVVNQGIRLGQGKGLGDYTSEISETLGLETNPNEPLQHIRNFFVDNAADFVAPSIIKGFGKGLNKSINYVDDINSINKELKLIRENGLSKGLSEKQIKSLQMEKVGITDNQRKAFTPVLSDVLSKYVKPISYEEGVISKLKDIPKNIKQGGWKNNPYFKDYAHTGKREDAWNLYLGKPQTNNTFRYSETVPKSMYYPELKNNLDIYNLNYEDDLADFVKYMDKSKTSKYSDLVSGNTIYPTDAGVMGGYNLTRVDGNFPNIGKGIVEYNDIWDLHPKTTMRSLFPKPIANNTWLNDNIFYKKSPSGGLTPREITLKMENFIGKPFMSHGRVPVEFETLPNTFKTISDKEQKLIDFIKLAKGYKFKSGGKVNRDWKIIKD